MIFSGKHSELFRASHPLAAIPRSPREDCQAGLVGLTSAHPSADTKQTSLQASGSGPSGFQWSQKHSAPCHALRREAGDSNGQDRPLHSQQPHRGALGGGQSLGRDERQAFLSGTSGKRLLNRK